MAQTAPADARAALAARLADELADPVLAASLAEGLDDTSVARLAVAGIATTPRLTYRPPTVPADHIDRLWILAFGYRRPGRDHEFDFADIPAMDELEPGPINEELARLAADFVARRPIPIVAQWEVADLLVELGVTAVVSVTPDIAVDGTITYLSTAGVIEKGLRSIGETGPSAGRAGVLGHADHAGRCLMSAREAGLRAAVPEGVDLPTDYDADSAQPWTRSRPAFVALDLMARAHS